MELIDTHCHLNDPSAFPSPSTTIAEANGAGVKRLIVIGIDTESSRRALQLAETHEGVYATVGWHPNYCAAFTTANLAEIRELATHPKCVGIGEIGLDYHWDFTPRHKQFEALEAQLDLADELGKPVVFHSREAYPDLLTVLERRPLRPYLLHCFAGDRSDAERALALGCLFGVDGPVTYPKAQDLREVIKFVGLDRLVIETDAPYLSPHPHRGKPNTPAWVELVAQGLATALGVTVEQVASATTANATRFFGI
jgi:TatD DNase family protein